MLPTASQMSIYSPAVATQPLTSASLKTEYSMQSEENIQVNIDGSILPSSSSEPNTDAQTLFAQNNVIGCNTSIDAVPTSATLSSTRKNGANNHTPREIRDKIVKTRKRGRGRLKNRKAKRTPAQANFTPSSQLQQQFWELVSQTCMGKVEKMANIENIMTPWMDKVNGEIMDFLREDRKYTRMTRHALHAKIELKVRNNIAADLTKRKRKFESQCWEKVSELLLQQAPDMRSLEPAPLPTRLNFVSQVTDQIHSRRLAPHYSSAKQKYQYPQLTTPKTLVLETSPVTPASLKTIPELKSFLDLPMDSARSPAELQELEIRDARRHVQKKLGIEDDTGNDAQQLENLIKNKKVAGADEYLMNWVTRLDDKIGSNVWLEDFVELALQLGSNENVFKELKAKTAKLEKDQYEKRKTIRMQKLDYVQGFLSKEHVRKAKRRIAAASSAAKEKERPVMWKSVTFHLAQELLRLNCPPS